MFIFFTSFSQTQNESNLLKKNLWIYITDSKDGEDLYYILDKYNSIDSGCVTIWTKSKNKIKLVNGHPEHNVEVKQLMVFNCKKNKFNILGYYVYNSKGKVIDKENFEKVNSFHNIPPESVVENLSKYICAKYY